MEKLKTFSGLILDGDGVWFTGEETRFVLPDGHVVIGKTRHFHDAQGLSFLRALGVKVLFASGEGEPLTSIVEKINSVPSAKSGEWAPVEVLTGLLGRGGKVAAIETWLSRQRLTWDECAYIGDDRTDLEAMRMAALKVVPGNARRVVSRIADIKLAAPGGAGAIREFAEQVLDVRGIDEAELPAA